jgi:hypothetical protein
MATPFAVFGTPEHPVNLLSTVSTPVHVTSV